jgi:hypothetical protein
MSAPEFFLTLFGFSAQTQPTERLEDRMNRFLQSEPTTESLDSEAFAQLIGAETKADYLLANRHFVAELKTINGNPKDRVEQRLKARFAQPGAPIVFGTLGLTRVLEGMSDRDQVLKVINDLSARSVRRHLQKSNTQIGAIKERLRLADAAGLTIIMNDSEPMIDAANIAYAIKNAFENVKGGYSHISYIWVSIERHRIRFPDGSECFPQLLITKSSKSGPELDFLGRMLWAWAHFNGARLQQMSHEGDWDTMAAIFSDPPPALALF